MASDDLLRTYQEKLASLYAGSTMDLPDRIEICAVDDLPHGEVAFGIIKNEGAWIIPDQFADIAVPILTREAYLTGFPDKVRASTSIQHACNWFAYKDIDDKAIKRKFLERWMVASMQKGPIDLYALPPVIMQEFDKIIDVPVIELHDLLRRFTIENERLLQHQLRIDVAETWGLAKTIEFAPPVDPVMIAILHACGTIFLDTAELPKKSAVMEYIAEHPFFGSITSSRIEREFARARLFFYCQYQFDACWIGKKYVHLVFTPSPRFANFDWNALLAIPGVFIRLNWYQGDLLGGSPGKPRSAIAWFLLPASAIEAFIEFVQTMHGAGMFAAHDVLVGNDIVSTVNYNAYVADPARPQFTIDPVKDEPDLFLSKAVEQSKTPAEASAFLATIVQNGLSKMRAFIDKLNSSFSIKEGRQDSWYKTIADVAGIHERTAMHWLDMLTQEHAVLVPEARNNYYFHPTIPVAIRLAFFTQSNLSTSDRRELAKTFPATSSVKTRSVEGDDVIIWNVIVPAGQMEAAIDLVASIEPSASVAMHFANLHETFGTLHSLLHWFDGESYDRLASFIEACTATLPNLARGSLTVAQFRRECHDPARATLDAIESTTSGGMNN